jgi:hypothetical protein
MNSQKEKKKGARNIDTHTKLWTLSNQL